MVEQANVSHTSKILDLPCGTGRLFSFWKSEGFARVTAADFSPDMLIEATKKQQRLSTPFTIEKCDLLRPVGLPDGYFELTACVRLLHLLSERDAKTALQELTRLTKSWLILTVQLGPRYRAGSDVATHAEKPFYRMLTALRWRVVRCEKITPAGWCVMLLQKN